MPDTHERIARLETLVAEVRDDVTALVGQMDRSRQRLHSLEGFAQAYLDIQRSNRRREEKQYRKLTSAISIGGLVIALGMLVLAAVTLWTHTR